MFYLFIIIIITLCFCFVLLCLRKQYASSCRIFCACVPLKMLSQILYTAVFLLFFEPALQKQLTLICLTKWTAFYYARNKDKIDYIFFSFQLKKNIVDSFNFFCQMIYIYFYFFICSLTLSLSPNIHFFRPHIHRWRKRKKGVVRGRSLSPLK